MKLSGTRGALATVGLLLAVGLSPAHAERLRQISEFLVSTLDGYAVGDAGSAVFFVADLDPLGTNPGHRLQVFRKELPAGDLTQLTALDAGVSDLSVSDDQTKILFLSAGELLVADGNGDSVVQLTSHAGDGHGAIEAVLAGGGGKALFVSDGNLTGANPLGYDQLFIIGTDGTGLLQLTATSTFGRPDHLGISDNGTRIIFSDIRNLTGFNADLSRELFSITSAGTGLKQMTANASVDDAVLSGQGLTVVFEDDLQLFVAPWGGTVPTLLAASAWHPALTDDGATVYFEVATNPASIRKVPSAGGASTVVWNLGDAREPVVAGAGSRLLFRATGDGVPFLVDPDAVELLATDADGASPEQVVDVGEPGSVWTFEMTADGSRIVFPWGTGEFYYGTDLYLADTASGDVVRITDHADALNPDISDDGETIAFQAWTALGPDACSDDGGIYRVGADGAGLEMISPDPATCFGSLLAQHPVISRDGSTVVLQDAGSPSGGNPGGGAEIYGVAATGGPVALVTDDDDSLYKNPRIDGDGTWVVFGSGSNLTGQNPDHGWEIFRIRSDGTGVEQITADPVWSSARPDVSADGTKIVFQSYADPLGTNSDHNSEIFLYDASTSTLEQLTATLAGNSFVPRISADGTWVAFASDSPWVGGGLSSEQVYRLDMATRDVRLVSAGIASNNRSVRNNLSFDVDNDGDVAFHGPGDLVGRNGDHSIELWLAELDAEPTFEASRESPTVLRWDPWPWALAYDVIRGDLAALAAGPGGTVDLGSVVCLEADSTDATTVGHGDPDEPAPGQGLFYLYRGWGGSLVGWSGWGEGTGGAERLPAAGDCDGATSVPAPAGS